MTEKLEIEIREIQENDLKGNFLESLNPLSKNTSNLGFNNAKTILNKIKSNSNHKIFVALYHNEIIGTGTLLIEPKFIHNGHSAGHIEDVSVLEEYQGKGVGAQLTETMLKHAEVHQCYKTVLECTDDVVPAYRNSGFVLYQNSMVFHHNRILKKIEHDMASEQIAREIGIPETNEDLPISKYDKPKFLASSPMFFRDMIHNSYQTINITNINNIIDELKEKIDLDKDLSEEQRNKSKTLLDTISRDLNSFKNYVIKEVGPPILNEMIKQFIQQPNY